jgi:predicted aspartyl protease
MVSGVFIQNNIPVLKILVAWGQALQTPFFILDTGFTGDLQVTPQIARDLGLQVTGVTNMRIANGQTVAVPTALALAAMEGAINYVQILISESMPLAGISFLSKFNYKAIVDCKYKTVVLERVA